MTHIVPTSGTPGVNGPSANLKQHRYSSSRSNSFSSASIVTVKRTASLSSSGRNSSAPLRAQSPVDASLITLRVGRNPTSQDPKRRQSVAIETSDRWDSDGLESSHRHSQSTSSSVASGTNTRRNRASSGALAGSLTGRGYSPKKKSVGTIDYSPRASWQKPSSRMQQSPATSPERERLRPSRPELHPLNSLPSLHATPALTEPNDTESPSTTQTITTPPTQASCGPDYFWGTDMSPASAAKGQPVMVRGQIAPVPAMEPQRGQASEGAEDMVAASRQLDQRGESERAQVIRIEQSAQQPAPSNSSSGRDTGRQRPRTRERGEKDKKTMLARALQQANTAVLLDNAQNFEGALEAYSDACQLLQQVTERSTGSDDKRKLNAIKYTYTTRIEELRQMSSAYSETASEKSLPARPASDDSLALSPALTSPTIDSTLKDSTVAVAGPSTSVATTFIPERPRDSLYSEASKGRLDPPYEEPKPLEAMAERTDALSDRSAGLRPKVDQEFEAKSINESQSSRTPTQEVSPIKTNFVRVLPPDSGKYMPAPLSPTRDKSSKPDNDPQRDWAEDLELMSPIEQQRSKDYTDNSTAASWLDTIDETSSRTPSVHSTSSEPGLHRKYLRGVSGVSSNPDFDAAFDAAVEAAYDQGLEPDTGNSRLRDSSRRKHETNESIPIRSSEIREITSLDSKFRLYEEDSLNAEDEEDRMLEEMAQDYAQSFDLDPLSKSALPRQSGSSGYSRSTWQSSQISDRTTAGTSLSTVAEDVLPPPNSKTVFAVSPSINKSHFEPIPPPPPPPLTAPPPQTALPKLPVTSQNGTASTVRNRRLSSQNMKQLKIETPGTSDSRKRASTAQSSSPVKENEQPTDLHKDFDFGMSLQPLSAPEAHHEPLLKSQPSLDSRSASVLDDDSRPATSMTAEQRESLDDDVGELRTYKPTFVKKSKSSDGLRQHMVLLASPTFDSGPALHTPLSSTFMNFSSKRMNETPLTSQRANLPTLESPAIGSSYQGVFLFDTSFSDSRISSAPKSPGVPLALEPCPESFLMRPFWLMRNIASTLAHPKGGYLTSRLFVPREVWQIKSLKLKHIEDKIANCDLLTAALGRLAGVDTFDADAVMEELESFEDVLERIQNTLAKKLGSEVGNSGLNSVFKDASASNAVSPDTSLAPDTNTGAEKVRGYMSSWRKLRQKSAGAPSVASQSSKSSTKTPEKAVFNMSTVPMTGYVSLDRRNNKKEARNQVFDGPNKDYMSSLAKLFDSVQVLDQIARQVEDPGLRGTSQTHVGLELSVRHAAEFFAFYVCRFVLADLGILIDKFMKRGAEWVLT